MKWGFDPGHPRAQAPGYLLGDPGALEVSALKQTIETNNRIQLSVSVSLCEGFFFVTVISRFIFLKKSLTVASSAVVKNTSISPQTKYLMICKQRFEDAT